MILILAGTITILCETEGYYKDVFMDGGVNLTSRTTLPAADSLGLILEFLSTEYLDWQTKVIIGSESDENGWLLYPDGAPRFRLLYSNGGLATSHGRSLGQEGRDRIRKFYNNGGCFVGSCAGAYIASIGYDYPETIEEYYHIWPGWTDGTGIEDTYIDHVIPYGSPILRYYDFGNDSLIADVYHNGGCYADERGMPLGTETLLFMRDQINTWAFKASFTTGRLIVTGSHPESRTTGEVLHLMMAIIQYSLDGQGQSHLKAELDNGEERIMNKTTSDSLPEYTKIGDKQYHHYKINLPSEQNTLQIILDGDDNYEFNLFLNKDNFALAGEADYEMVESGADKEMQLDGLPPGEYYIGVKCVNTVMSVTSIYIGDLSVLNGVKYSITASWNEELTNEIASVSQPCEYILNQNYPNPFNPSTTISYELPKSSYVMVSIFDVCGHLIETLINSNQTAGKYQVQWNASGYSTGMYFYLIETPEFQQVRKMILMK